MRPHLHTAELARAGNDEQAESLRRHLAILRAACAAPSASRNSWPPGSAKAAVGANGCVLFGNDEQTLTVAAADGYPPHLAAIGTRLPLDDGTAGGFAARRHAAVWVADVEEKSRRFPQMR